jgi:hypothetical protein
MKQLGLLAQRRLASKFRLLCSSEPTRLSNKIKLLYYEEEPDYEEELVRRSAAKLLTKDEARRIAANVAKLSELLRKN